MSFDDQNGAAPAAADAPAIVDSPAPAPVETVNTPSNDPPRSMEDTAGDVWDRLHAPRDEAGKFSAKAPETVEPGKDPSATTTDTPASPAPAGEAPKAPVSWPQDKAEAWTKLDPAARVLEPVKARLQAEGVTPAQAVQRLLSAQAHLERDPITALNWLARSYGVNLSQLTQQQQPGQEQTQQPLTDPRVETLQQRIDRLETEAQTRAKQEAETFEQTLKSDVDKFRASPEHPYFDDVKTDMAGLLSAGTAEDLKDAYEKAVWVNPTVRAKVLDDQRKAEATKAAEAAAKARQAGSLNVRSTPANAAPPKSIDETLAAAWDSVQNR